MITHAVPIAALLAPLPHIELHLLPGRVRTATQAAVGHTTVEAIGQLRADLAFIGTNGISVRHGLSTPDPEEAATKRALVAGAERVVVLTDSTKVGQERTVRFADLDDVDVLVTDDGDRHRRRQGVRGRGPGGRPGLSPRRGAIVTLTANPSFDRTIALPEPLERGAVHRVDAMTSQAGGKGVNISRAAVAAGLADRSPCSRRDPTCRSSTSWPRPASTAGRPGRQATSGSTSRSPSPTAPPPSSTVPAPP